MRRRLACPACLQRGAPPPFDSDESFAASRGKNDYAPIAVSYPRIQGLVLIIPQYNHALQLWTGQEIENLIPEVEAGCFQKIDNILVIQSHRSEGLGALIPCRIRDPDAALNLNCALIKGKLHGLLAQFLYIRVDTLSPINLIFLLPLKKASINLLALFLRISGSFVGKDRDLALV